MSSHDETPVDTRGPEVEKWIFRSLLLGVLGALAAAIVASLDDIQRYLRIKDM